MVPIIVDTCILRNNIAHTCMYNPCNVQSMCSQVLQLCLALCNPVDHSLAVSTIHGRCPARILEWVAISSSGDFPHPGVEPVAPASPAWQADSWPAEPLGKPVWSTLPSLFMSFPLFVFYNISSGGLAHDIVPSLWEELRFRGIKESTLFWG